MLMFLAYLALFWAAPIYVAKGIGNGKGRTSSWLWGFFFGWLGVGVVALQSPARAS